MVSSKTISLAISKLSSSKDKYINKCYDNLLKALSAILIKVIEYEEKENICGLNRNSYYKVDKDATTMTLKTNYYAGLGTHRHAAYNT